MRFTSRGIFHPSPYRIHPTAVRMHREVDFISRFHYEFACMRNSQPLAKQAAGTMRHSGSHQLGCEIEFIRPIPPLVTHLSLSLIIERVLTHGREMERDRFIPSESAVAAYIPMPARPIRSGIWSSRIYLGTSGPTQSDTR